jgi:hypothetical protein
MAKLNRQKLEKDVALVKRKLDVAADVTAFTLVTYPLGVAIQLAGRFALSKAPEPLFLEALECGTFTTIVVWPLVMSHYAFIYGENGLVDLILAGKHGKRDKPKLWKYLRGMFLRGLVIVLAGGLTELAVGSLSALPLARVIGWCAGAGVATAGFYVASWFRDSIERSTAPEDTPLVRGTAINTFNSAAIQAKTFLAYAHMGKPPEEKRYSIRWAGLDLPGDIESHFGIVGINGSGKTVALQALMRSVLPSIVDDTPKATASRALVFDPENKFIPLLQSLVGEEKVSVLNPFDKRSRPWDLAKDIDDLATAQEMASIFIAEQKGDSQPFWQRTARGILSAVLKALHLKAPGKWTLRHVFHIVTNEPRLTAVLRATDQTQGLIELLRPTNQTLFNVLAELRSHMDMLEIIAALWDNSVKVLGVRPFTLKDWLLEHGVLVFGRPTQLEDTVNRVLIKRLSQLIRAPLERSPDASFGSDPIEVRGRTWIFLDELRNIGNLPGIEKLLTEGRSRGARVVITFQDIDGLREVYSERIAEEIANQCDTMSYLRSRGTTAKWAAERLGRCEYWDKDFSSGSSSGYGGSSTNTGQTSRKQITDAVLESELSGIPPVKKEERDGKNGGFIQGWHVVPAIERIFPARGNDVWYPFEKVDGIHFEKRDAEDQILRPWDEETDWNELGFKPEISTQSFRIPDVEGLRGNTGDS